MISEQNQTIATMNKPKYQIGDRVRVVRNDCPIPQGWVGIVSYVFSEIRAIAVEFSQELANLNFDDVEKI